MFLVLCGPEQRKNPRPGGKAQPGERGGSGWFDLGGQCLEESRRVLQDLECLLEGFSPNLSEVLVVRAEELEVDFLGNLEALGVHFLQPDQSLKSRLAVRGEVHFVEAQFRGNLGRKGGVLESNEEQALRSELGPLLLAEDCRCFLSLRVVGDQARCGVLDGIPAVSLCVPVVNLNS